MKKLVFLDTTLRDGTQSASVSFTVEDKLLVASKLDKLGIDYIEAGWPGSNPRDEQFFQEAKTKKYSFFPKLTAFGSTCRALSTPEEDINLQKLIESEVNNIVIFGKTWDLHVKEGLGISLDRNIEMIHDSLAYLKARVDKVIYDCEHFFDGYKSNKDYAIQTVKAAIEAKADFITLCDTNGGCLPDDISRAMDDLRSHIGDYPLGIHTHNDSGCAVANTIVAVEHGATMVQGTINGFGERCGNADLCTIIPNLQIKKGYECIPEDKLIRITKTSRSIYEIGNLIPNAFQPYTGKDAFSHKGGIHVSAILKNAKMYEHINPEIIGNSRGVLLSDLSGRANLKYKIQSMNLKKEPTPENFKVLLGKLKTLENQGYVYEAAEASFELLIRKEVEDVPNFFKIESFRLIDQHADNKDYPDSEATVKIEVNGVHEHTAASSTSGPVNALDIALRKALLHFYPALSSMNLIDFKVRIVDSQSATAAKIRVLIASSDGEDSWTTIGVSENIVVASYLALIDSFEYKLMKDYFKGKQLDS